MRKTFLFQITFVLLLFLFAGCEKKENKRFVLRADLKGLENDTVLIRDATSYSDTTYIVKQSKGRFEFEIPVDTFRIFDVYVNDGSRSFTVFADKGTEVSVSGDIDSMYVSLKGGVVENSLLSTFEKDLSKKLFSIVPDGYTGKRPISLDWPDSILSQVFDSINSEAAKYIRNNTSSYTSAVIFDKYLWNSAKPNYNLVDSLLEGLSGVLLDLPKVQAAKSISDLKKKVQKGKYIYPDRMKFLNNEGEASADEIRKNYLFLEFWASWSDASLAYRDSLKTVFNKYKNKKDSKFRTVNFVGVSLDTDTVACKISVNERDIKWKQICDMKYWGSPWVSKYAISYIPDNVLVAPGNKIIARGLSVRELEKILDEEFSKE